MKKMIMPILAGLLVSGAAFANFPTVLDNAGTPTEVRDDLRMGLFPNPNNTGFVRVMIDNIDPKVEKIELSILSPQGRPAFSEVFQIRGEAKQFIQGVDINRFEPGIYTVRAVVGDQVLRQRLVVR